MKKVYSKQISYTMRKALFDIGFFGDMPEITGTIPEGKRDYFKRVGKDISETSAAKVEVTLGDVLDWIREEGMKNISVDPYRDSEGIKYCGKVVDLMTGCGSINYASEDFEIALETTIFEVLKEWK